MKKNLCMKATAFLISMISILKAGLEAGESSPPRPSASETPSSPGSGPTPPEDSTTLPSSGMMIGGTVLAGAGIAGAAALSAVLLQKKGVSPAKDFEIQGTKIPEEIRPVSFVDPSGPSEEFQGTETKDAQINDKVVKEVDAFREKNKNALSSEEIFPIMEKGRWMEEKEQGRYYSKIIQITNEALFSANLFKHLIEKFEAHITEKIPQQNKENDTPFQKTYNNFQAIMKTLKVINIEIENYQKTLPSKEKNSLILTQLFLHQQRLLEDHGLEFLRKFEEQGTNDLEKTKNCLESVALLDRESKNIEDIFKHDKVIKNLVMTRTQQFKENLLGTVKKSLDLASSPQKENMNKLWVQYFSGKILEGREPTLNHDVHYGPSAIPTLEKRSHEAEYIVKEERNPIKEIHDAHKQILAEIDASKEEVTPQKKKSAIDQLLKEKDHAIDHILKLQGLPDSLNQERKESKLRLPIKLPFQKEKPLDSKLKQHTEKLKEIMVEAKRQQRESKEAPPKEEEHR